MKRRDYYRDWDGVCVSCGHDYFECRGNCTCLSCNAQRDNEVGRGLKFDEDDVDESADEIKSLRQALGLTQAEFALKIGVSMMTVSRWERGETQPSPLAQALISQLQNSVKLLP